MRIGDLSERSGVSRATIRFYERNGLISSQPGVSETNNYRDYPEENVALLGFFSKARDAGVSVADLQDIMGAIGSQCDEATARTIVQSKIEELKQRAKQIETVVAFLEAQMRDDQGD